jgi:hypothetical protein
MADDLSPRERRRARAKTRGLDLSWARHLIIPAIIILVLASVVAMVVYQDRASSRTDCPGHWHTTFNVYVNGQVVDFHQPPFMLQGDRPGGGEMPISMHMHYPDDDILHYEPTVPDCMSVRETFDRLGIGLNRNSMSIESFGHSVSGDFAPNATHKLRAFYAEYNMQNGTFDWEERPWTSFIRMGQPKDLSKILIVYGDETDEEIEAYQARVRNPPGWGQG